MKQKKLKKNLGNFEPRMIFFRVQIIKPIEKRKKKSPFLLLADVSTNLDRKRLYLTMYSIKW